MPSGLVDLLNASVEVAVLVLIGPGALLFRMLMAFLGPCMIMSFLSGVLMVMTFLLMMMVLFRLGTLSLDSNIFSIRVYTEPIGARVSGV